MNDELAEIRLLRKKLDLTQSELASQAKVSQSFIAKIEAGLIDPTYSKTKQILEVLHSLSKSTEQKAVSLMSRKLITVSPETDLKEVIQIMRRHSISQLPVTKGSQCLGIISESNLIDSFGSSATKVKEVMAESPPTVSKDATLSVISPLLRFYPLVLVQEQGKLIGLITKADLLKVL